MGIRRPSTYSYPPKFNKLEDAENYSKRLYAELLENDSRGEEITARATDKDLKELIVRPEWYKAKGDGVTDDTVAIQAALDALPATGGTVICSSAAYKITNQLVPHNNAGMISKTLILLGPNTTITTYDTTAGHSVFNVSKAAGTYRSGAEGELTIRGGCITQSGATVLHGVNIHAQNTVIDNVRINGFGGYGITFTSDLAVPPLNPVVKNCIVSFNDIGIYKSVESENFHVDNCRIEGNGKEGINISDNNTETWIENNLIEGNGFVTTTAPQIRACGGVLHINNNYLESNPSQVHAQIIIDGSLWTRKVSILGNKFTPYNLSGCNIVEAGVTSTVQAVEITGNYFMGGDTCVTFGPYVNSYNIGVNGFAQIQLLDTLEDPCFERRYDLGNSLGGGVIYDFVPSVAKEIYFIRTSPISPTVKLDCLAPGYLPYQVSYPVGLMSSGLFFDGEKLGLGPGTELLVNGEFSVNTGSWTPVDCTIASVPGGIAGNCLEITRTAGIMQNGWQNVAGLTPGVSYRFSVWVKSGSSGDEVFDMMCRWSSDYVTDSHQLQGLSSSTWTKYTLAFTATSAGYQFRLAKFTDTPGTMLFDTASLQGPPETTELLDLNGNTNVTGVYKVAGVQVLGAQAVAQADLKANYTTLDLDTEAEIIAAINATNTGFNTLLAKLRTHGILDT
jgi:hypothetical protein